MLFSFLLLPQRRGGLLPSPTPQCLRTMPSFKTLTSLICVQAGHFHPTPRLSPNLSSPPVASLSFLVWDILITLDHEVEAIWTCVPKHILSLLPSHPHLGNQTNFMLNGCSFSSAILQFSCRCLSFFGPPRSSSFTHLISVPCCS